MRNIKHYNVTLHKRAHSYHSQRQKKAAAWKKVAYKNAERHTGKGQGTASLWTVYAVHDMVVTSNLKRYRGRGLPETEKKTRRYSGKRGKGYNLTAVGILFVWFGKSVGSVFPPKNVDRLMHVTRHCSASICVQKAG